MIRVTVPPAQLAGMVREEKRKGRQRPRSEPQLQSASGHPITTRLLKICSSYKHINIVNIVLYHLGRGNEKSLFGLFPSPCTLFSIVSFMSFV